MIRYEKRHRELASQYLDQLMDYLDANAGSFTNYTLSSSSSSWVSTDLTGNKIVSLI